ncbi:MAG: hypothetical protein U0411_14925, partial [Thermodesulfovibrionales bacterium]
ALVFSPGKEPEVRTLRKDFPELPHRHHTPPGEPLHLCLYSVPWSFVERTWTPQCHLKFIVQWLTEASKGTLHREDQMPERVYYRSPKEIVLPPDFDEKAQDRTLALFLVPIWKSNRDYTVLRGVFRPLNQADPEIPNTEVLIVELSPVVHGEMEDLPSTLGEVHDQLLQRGADLLTAIAQSIRLKADLKGITRRPEHRCLLMVIIPLLRKEGSKPERFDSLALYLDSDIASLGEKMGTLFQPLPAEPILFSTSMVGERGGPESLEWRDIHICQIELKPDCDKHKARKWSGIHEGTADFKGVLAGAGALGGGHGRTLE